MPQVEKAGGGEGVEKMTIHLRTREILSLDTKAPMKGLRRPRRLRRRNHVSFWWALMSLVMCVASSTVEVA